LDERRKPQDLGISRIDDMYGDGDDDDWCEGIGDENQNELNKIFNYGQIDNNQKWLANESAGATTEETKVEPGIISGQNVLVEDPFDDGRDSDQDFHIDIERKPTLKKRKEEKPQIQEKTESSANSIEQQYRIHLDLENSS